MTMKKFLMAAVAVGAFSTAANAATLDDVKGKGFVQCGVTTGLAGFAAPDDKGEWAGFDVDFCRGVAAAIFGDANAIKFTPTTGANRFTALQSGEIDLLYRNTTWTFSRDVNLGLTFLGVNYYDGQGFMVRKDLGVKSASELDGASVCIQTGTTTELNLADYFRANNLSFTSVVVQTGDEARQAYEAGRCDVYTTDASGLAAQRSTMADPAEHILLPEIISKEPLGPLVRHGDDQWGDVVRWAFYATLIAEEKGITQGNVDEVAGSSADPEVLRLLGKEGDFGQQLGLPNEWAHSVIKAIGNYGEVFERNVGKDTPLALERGLNALWTQGGLQYAPPIR